MRHTITRQPNTDCNGIAFSLSRIEAVWEKGRIVSGEVSAKIRKDRCGARIEHSKYGKTSVRGWEIDHIKPVAKGGMDDLSNLQPLQWGNNRHKSDTYPWRC